MSGDWYCRNCGYLSAGRVTFSETCDECHIPVEWHEEGQMTYIEELEADRARLNEKVKRLEKAVEKIQRRVRERAKKIVMSTDDICDWALFDEPLPHVRRRDGGC